jgi:glycosyltransferase involved in cell wall biosynthesis
MKGILYDARWIGDHGVGRFAGELQKVLPDLTPFQARRRPWHPLDPLLLGAALRRKKPKLFFSPGYNSPLGWPGAFVFTLHDLHHLHVPANALKRAYYRYLIGPACHRAAFVLTVSEYSKREIAEWAHIKEEKIINVGNGVGLPFTPEGKKHDPGYPYLLYVGSRRFNKNLPRLLKAYCVSGVRKEVRLMLTGHPDENLSGLIRSLGLNGDVVFAGLCTDTDLSDLYRGALALLYPSLYEGFGLPPLEAMACGVPVLTTNVCSIPEVVGNAAIQVDPLKVEEIADGIIRLVEDSALRQGLRERGLLRAKEFSWHETARRTSAVLKLATEVGCYCLRDSTGRSSIIR